MEIKDSTVYVLPGVARVGNTLMSFPGAISTFDRLYSTDASRYQNVLLYIQDANGMPDMTKVATFADTYADIRPPYMPDSSGYPLSVLTFDGSTSSGLALLSYTPL